MCTVHTGSQSHNTSHTHAAVHIRTLTHTHTVFAVTRNHCGHPTPHNSTHGAAMQTYAYKTSCGAPWTH